MRRLRRTTKQLSSFFLLFFLWNCTTTSNMDSDGNMSGSEDGSSMSGENGYGVEGSDLSDGVLRVEKIHFDFDRDSIKEEFRADLEEVADYMKRNPSATLRINGHCDERGTAEYNLALGQKRADEVKRFLVNHGVDADRLTTHTYGKEMLIDMSGTELGHYQNRRAEFISSNAAEASSPF